GTDGLWTALRDTHPDLVVPAVNVIAVLVIVGTRLIIRWSRPGGTVRRVWRGWLAAFDSRPAALVVKALLGLAAWSVRWAWPNAVRSLRHYLGNSGKELDLDVDRMLHDLPNFQERVRKHISNRIPGILAEVEETGAYGEEKWFDSGWQSALPDDGDWYRTVGYFRYRVTGTAIVSRPVLEGDGPQLHRLTYRVKVSDTYDWNRAEVTIRHVRVDRLMDLPHRFGLAHPFNARGESQRKRYRGEEAVRPPPAGPRGSVTGKGLFEHRLVRVAMRAFVPVAVLIAVVLVAAPAAASTGGLVAQSVSSPLFGPGLVVAAGLLMWLTHRASTGRHAAPGHTAWRKRSPRADWSAPRHLTEAERSVLPDDLGGFADVLVSRPSGPEAARGDPRRFEGRSRVLLSESVLRETVDMVELAGLLSEQAEARARAQAFWKLALERRSKELPRALTELREAHARMFVRAIMKLAVPSTRVNRPEPRAVDLEDTPLDAAASGAAELLRRWWSDDHQVSSLYAANWIHPYPAEVWKTVAAVRSRDIREWRTLLDYSSVGDEELREQDEQTHALVEWLLWVSSAAERNDVLAQFDRSWPDRLELLGESLVHALMRQQRLIDLVETLFLDRDAARRLDQAEEWLTGVLLAWELDRPIGGDP
ncbi:MAG: hypothetical protein J2P19_32910, partial [Pseudonocardia sp.]|nr:hypothetical protein [Pseudonocardia sp.]